MRQLPFFFACLASVSTESAIVLDIGSNIGIYALGAASYGYTVHAFEPLLRNYAPICYSSLLNPGFTDFVHVYKTALSSELRKVGFFSLWYTNPSATRITDNVNAIGSGQESIDWAWAIPLTEIRLPDEPNNVIMKVDTEGHECLAIAGAMEYLLKATHIVYVAIEWTASRLQECENRQEIFDLFQSHDLKPFIHRRENETYNEWLSVEYKNWQDWRNPTSAGNSTPFDVHFAPKRPFLPVRLPLRTTKQGTSNEAERRAFRRNRRSEPATVLQIDS